jgi:aspartyl-tRNA(Asn)/glutamyl-tRNA(Gln) amidotransferase subunit B
MEEGSMRVDTNISITPIGSDKLGTKVELKNLNSFNFVKQGLAYEEKRQSAILKNGGTIGQETRRFDEKSGETVLMRVKSGADDYRYFPEPDLPAFDIDPAWIKQIKDSLPEPAEDRRARYINELGIPEYDAGVLTDTKEMSDFFDETVKFDANPKLVSNWLMGEVNGYLNEKKIGLLQTKLRPEHLAKMINLISDGTISSKIAKKVFQETISNGTEPEGWVKEKGLIQESDPNVLKPMIIGVLDNNQQSIDDFKNGKDRAVGFLVGQIMKQTHGQANPKVVNKILMEELNSR